MQVCHFGKEVIDLSEVAAVAGNPAPNGPPALRVAAANLSSTHPQNANEVSYKTQTARQDVNANFLGELARNAAKRSPTGRHVNLVG